MIPEGTDRDALREQLERKMALPSKADVTERIATRHRIADAILDADDILVVDLRCPTCRGTGVDVAACSKSYITGDGEPYNIGTGCACHFPEWCATDPFEGCDECAGLDGRLGNCPTCGGTGRRDVRVVDADSIVVTPADIADVLDALYDNRRFDAEAMLERWTQ